MQMAELSGETGVLAVLFHVTVADRPTSGDV